MSAERLAALYEQLEDVRDTVGGAWMHRLTSQDQEEYDSQSDAIAALEREEDDILADIESLGGEDPDL